VQRAAFENYAPAVGQDSPRIRFRELVPRIGFEDLLHRLAVGIGPTRPTLAMQQVGSYLGYTGRDPNEVAKAALRLLTLATPWEPAAVTVHAVSVASAPHGFGLDAVDTLACQACYRGQWSLWASRGRA